MARGSMASVRHRAWVRLCRLRATHHAGGVVDLVPLLALLHLPDRARAHLELEQRPSK